ncbi:MAG: DUF3486 family protein [Aquincola sp.]|nr:DUF3486 family protein [Aquincola sp.]
MAPRSKVVTLPPAVKAWLDEALVAGNFSGYEALAAELKARGCEVSKSALHRYGSAFEQQLANLKLATEQAKAVVAASPDDAGDMNEALIRLVQQKTFRVLQEVEIDPEKVSFEKLSLNVARLARASVPLKKWALEAKLKLQASLDKAVKDAEAGTETSALALLKRVREEAYGIFDE